VTVADAFLLSRAVVTWAELLVVGFAGSALGGATSGPPQLVVYLATTLVSVLVLFHNVDRLVAERTQTPAGDGEDGTRGRDRSQPTGRPGG
jgi:hypothetical protein